MYWIIIAILLYPIATLFLFVASRKQDARLVIFFSVVGFGPFWLNLIASLVFFSDDRFAGPGLETFGKIITLLSCIIIMYSMLPQPKIGFQIKSFGNRSKRSILMVLAVPFAITSIFYCWLGIKSGGGFGSTVWRSSISSGSAGWMFYFYNSGVVLFSALFSSRAIAKTQKVFLLFLVGVFLSIYGGRFLLSSALLITFLISLSGSEGFQFRIKHVAFIGLISFMMISLGGYRYSNEYGLDFNFELAYATFSRQTAGSVYDFALSYGASGIDRVGDFISEKFSVAMAPFLSNYNEDVTSGALLAEMAARKFEGGHRISGFGEMYYFLGFFGVGLFICACIAFVRMAELLIAQNPDSVTGRAILFVLMFAIFIDVSYLIGGLYLILYVWIIEIFFRYKEHLRSVTFY